MHISKILLFDFHATNLQVYSAFNARYPLCAVDEGINFLLEIVCRGGTNQNCFKNRISFSKNSLTSGATDIDKFLETKTNRPA